MLFNLIYELIFFVMCDIWSELVNSTDIIDTIFNHAFCILFVIDPNVS